MRTEEKKLFLGLLFVPAYLLQQSIIIRCVQFTILIAVYIFRGGRFRVFPNFMLVSGIILAYIIRPAGKVLFMVGNFPVTQGSLNSGFSRALMLIGLIYISRLSVSGKLQLKGKVGNLIGRVFYYFEIITEGQGTFPFKNFYKKGFVLRLVNYIDNLLITFENKEYKKEIKIENKNLSKINSILLFTFIFVSFLLLLPVFNLK